MNGSLVSNCVQKGVLSPCSDVSHFIFITTDTQAKNMTGCSREEEQIKSFLALCPPDFLDPASSLIILSSEMGAAPPGPRTNTAGEILSPIFFSLDQ